MQIAGPFSIQLIEDDAGSGRELHFSFTDAFKSDTPTARKLQFDQHLSWLREAAADADEADRQGLVVVAQVCEALQPHIDADELPLDETIVIEIETSVRPGGILGTLMSH